MHDDNDAGLRSDEEVDHVIGYETESSLRKHRLISRYIRRAYEYAPDIESRTFVSQVARL